MDKKGITEKKKIKYFDEEWPKHEELLKLGLKVSKRNKAERFNKSPAKDLIDQIEGRKK